VGFPHTALRRESVPTIAITGKGGTGKTTFASLLVKHLSTKAPLSWLSMQIRTQTWTRGSECTSSKRLATYERICSRAFPAGVAKSELIEYQIRLALVEGDTFDLSLWDDLKDPDATAISTTCCAIPRQLSVNYDYVVIDNELVWNTYHDARREMLTCCSS